jgi:hypothetical protein
MTDDFAVFDYYTMKLLVSCLAILPAAFGLMAHLCRETDSLLLTFLGLWLVFTFIGVIWGFFLTHRNRSLGRQCMVYVLAQFLAFCYLIFVIDARAKTHGLARTGCGQSMTTTWPDKSMEPTGDGALSCISHFSSGVAEPGRYPASQLWNHYRQS